jgi:CRP-like cAMP-binding protein
LLSYPTKTWGRGETIIEEGEKVRDIHLIVTGLATRSKSLPDGNRQLMAFLVPGDLCDVEVFVLEAMDHDIVAVSDTTCVMIPAKVIEDLLTENSNITKGLWWSTMTDSAVLRQWIVGHGSRDARERIAHLFVELLIRYRIVGETTDDSFAFPMTQEELADATGMTAVHVNRVLQQLRSENLIELKGKTLTILDPDRLQEIAQFDANYLHLPRTERGDPEVAGRAGDLVSPVHEGIFQEAIGKIKGAIGTSRD